MASNRSRPIKRARRTKAEMAAIKLRIRDVLRKGQPMTDRQLFYRLVSLGIIDKTEAQYKNTVVRLLSKMRLAGVIPFHWIADNTRWMRKPQTDSGLEQALMRTAEAYRRSVWDNQAAYVEIWLEKDALAGVLYKVTSAWDVPLMVTRGFASLSFLYSAACEIREKGKPTYLYYFGDHDPSGLDIPRTIEARLREFAPEAEIYFERVAVTPQQIEEMALPTRPTKRTDSRSKNFEGDSVEVDAIEPAILRRIAEECITKHIDQRQLAALKEIELLERVTLSSMVNAHFHPADGEELDEDSELEDLEDESDGEALEDD